VPTFLNAEQLVQGVGVCGWWGVIGNIAGSVA
jgi:hypothetical protein